MASVAFRLRNTLSSHDVYVKRSERRADVQVELIQPDEWQKLRPHVCRAGPADVGERRFWRLDRAADYGAFNPLSRHLIKVDLIERHWGTTACEWWPHSSWVESEPRN